MSPNLRLLVCIIRGHDWSRWATRKAPDTTNWGERRCRRCGNSQLGAAPKPRTAYTQKNRAANAADTVTPNG